MSYISPAQARLNRLRRNRDAGHAVSRALDQAAEHVTGADRRRLEVLARRMSACAANATFRIVTPPGEASVVKISNRRGCKSALCMQDARFRAGDQVRKAFARIQIIRDVTPDAKFAFVTLTSRNRPVHDVKSMLDAHEAGLGRFWRARPLARALLGQLTSIEIAIRGTPEVPMAGVHSHSLAVLHPEYFSRQRDLYLSQKAICSLWGAAMRLDYQPICDVRRIYTDSASAMPSLLGACVEVLKYSIAPQTLFQRDDYGMYVTPEVIGPLALALYKRRLIRFSGCFSTAAKTLRQREGA